MLRGRSMAKAAAARVKFSCGESTEGHLCRQAAAVCNVTPPVVGRWLSLGLVSGPPWTLQQLRQVRELTDPEGGRRAPQAAHGTLTRWLEGWDCDGRREAQNDAARAHFRRRAQARLPVEVRKPFLDAIYARKPFKTAIRDFGLTSNKVWGLTKADVDWATALEAALIGVRPGDLKHGTSPAYVAGCCVCRECRASTQVDALESEITLAACLQFSV
jgi:hypothetical protein